MVRMRLSAAWGMLWCSGALVLSAFSCFVVAALMTGMSGAVSKVPIRAALLARVGLVRPQY
jgi:hypothetical protein